jgi:uncharacterized protein (TIGR02246 family)
MTRNITAQQLHSTFEEAFNRQDLDGLVAMYEPDAVMVQPDGSLAIGLDAIRQHFLGVLATNGRMTVHTRYAVEAANTTLMSCEWTLTAGDETKSAVTAEVARRQPNGGWLYFIDHPFASLEPEAAAAIGPEAATSGI